MRASLTFLIALLLAACPASAKNSFQAVLDLDARRGFVGAVLVAHGDDILLARGVGRVGRDTPTPDSRFWIASSGKQFASAAILLLVQEKRIGLDDPLRRFFPDCPADKAGITVRQLLSHNSGFAQSYVSEGVASREAAVARMLAEPLAGPPGSGFRYSNINIQLAAALVEIVAGMPYSEFARTRLWQPAGLTGTGFAGTPGAVQVMPIAGPLPPRLRAAYWGEQGIYSSARDLFRWVRLLDKGRLIDKAHLAMLWTPTVPIQEGQAALGWFVGRSMTKARTIFVRGNEDFGANSLIYLYPDRDFTVIVLTHAGEESADHSWSRTILSQIEAQFGL
jgi:CubicO group peptidase (beta-lactamase class C family)